MKLHKKSLFMYSASFNKAVVEKRKRGNSGKNPEPPKLDVTWRINALVMLINVSLLIRALIQYKVRKGVDKSNEELPRIGWDKKKLTRPTIKFVLEVMEVGYFIKTGEY